MITCNFSLAGLNELRVAYQSSTYSPINYPIYPLFVSGSNEVLSLQQNTTNKTFTLNPTVGVLYEDLPSTFGSFTEELVIDQNGRYYKRTFNFSTILDDNLLTLLNQKHVMFFATDSNGINWLFGYDHPMKLVSYNRNSGMNNDGNDRYDLSYNSISYIPIKQYILS